MAELKRIGEKEKKNKKKGGKNTTNKQTKNNDTRTTPGSREKGTIKHICKVDFSVILVSYVSAALLKLRQLF